MTWLLLLACQIDPLVAVGLDPALPPPPPVEAAVPAAETSPTGEVAVAEGAIPAGAAVADAEPGPEGEPDAEVASASSPVRYDPISRPLGPREEGGVRWEGVGSKFEVQEVGGPASRE